MNKFYYPLKKIHPILKILDSSFINLPTPININFFWNFGSLLGLCLIIQIITGLFLTMHYTPHMDLAFYSINHIMRNVNYGWVIRNLHMNTASFFFICVYFHIGRGMYHESYLNMMPWMTGTLIFFILMMTAFLGYVLPWGQMSLWGATVITNLLSAIPYIGDYLVKWIWGSFSVSNATLNRFYSFHFLFPFILMALIVIHLLFIHQKGSSNPIGTPYNIDKIPFHPYFTFKDILGFIIMLFLLNMLILMSPNLLGDTDNFIMANSMVTPVHIQPEWYFLFAYAILRSIPNKLGGVLGLIMSIAILFIMPFMPKKPIKGNQFYFLNQILFWFLLINLILLTWIGAKPVEDPYILIGQIFTFTYFFYYLINVMMNFFWTYLNK